jgi:type II secretion system protein N
VKRLLAAVIIGAAVIAGSWFVVFPERTLLTLISNSMNGSGLTADVSGFRKGFFYDFTAGNVALKKTDRTLLTAQDLSCRLDLYSLLLLKPALRCEGEIAGGRIKGNIGLLQGKGPVKVSLEDAHVEELPFLSSMGIGGSGNISGKMHIEKGAGEILFAVRDAHLLPASFGGIKVPLDVFSGGTGALELDGRVLRVKSFSLEGDGIYARVKGNVEGNRMNLIMELMPEKSFVEENPAFALLATYRDSPGHYLIPITTAVNF